MNNNARDKIILRWSFHFYTILRYDLQKTMMIACIFFFYIYFAAIKTPTSLEISIPNLNHSPFRFLCLMVLTCLLTLLSIYIFLSLYLLSISIELSLWRILRLKMGDISFSNGTSNGNGNAVGGQRKSCWYEEEIEENLRWCFALNRYILFRNVFKV